MNVVRITILFGIAATNAPVAQPTAKLFEHPNLVAWCVVPFDASERTPEQRAEMLARLGFAKLAYDWRAAHVPTFAEEIEALKRHGIEMFAFWGEHESAFELFERHDLHPQIWSTAPSPKGKSREERIAAAVEELLPLVARTKQLSCKLGLYNHGGWGGQPRNLVAVCKRLRAQHEADHVGIVYNLHHGHAQIDDFARALATMQPYLLCLNLNGMNRDARPKIVALGKGEHERAMIAAIASSGYAGPIGILDHRPERDAEQSLRENLDGLRAIVAAGLPATLGSRSRPAGKSAMFSFRGSTAHTYKSVGDLDLRLHVFEPEGHQPTDRRPAIVFFFGGGWTGGTPQQFVPHCEYLSTRGMIAITAEYRVKRRGNATPFDCVADGKSAMRWVRAHAPELGVDPDRIVAGGGSAGGHVAACTGTLAQRDELEGSARPNAMVLFNPVVDTGSSRGLRARIGERWRELSPTDHVRAGLPPTLVLHGTGDKTVAFADVEKFTERMREHGNRCELAAYDGRGHGFFNHRKNTMKDYVATVRRMDEFLASLGYVEGEPTLRDAKR